MSSNKKATQVNQKKYPQIKKNLEINQTLKSIHKEANFRRKEQNPANKNSPSQGHWTRNRY